MENIRSNKTINERRNDNEISVKPFKNETNPNHLAPKYTKGEEIFNTVSHITGAAWGCAILVICIIASVLRNTTFGITASIIYGISMIMVYTISSVYHGLRPSKAKRVMRIIDHCDIYFLIAGTYTPILLTAIRQVNPTVAYTLLAVQWGVAFLAITLTAVNMEKYKVFSMLCYIVMGWCIVVVAPIVIQALTLQGFLLILIGGIIYTIGSILYGIGRKVKYMHSIFHLFCLGGTMFQFMAIILYCI